MTTITATVAVEHDDFVFVQVHEGDEEEGLEQEQELDATMMERVLLIRSGVGTDDKQDHEDDEGILVLDMTPKMLRQLIKDWQVPGVTYEQHTVTRKENEVRLLESNGRIKLLKQLRSVTYPQEGRCSRDKCNCHLRNC